MMTIFPALAAAGQIFPMRSTSMHQPKKTDVFDVRDFTSKTMAKLIQTFRERRSKMNSKFFDVIVAKEYEVKQNGIAERRTAWNKVGRAWTSKSTESLSFELFLIPNQRYVIQLKDRQQEQEVKSEETPFKGEIA